jgi:hypothetical protein
MLPAGRTFAICERKLNEMSRPMLHLTMMPAPVDVARR